MSALIDLIGQQFGDLTVIERAPNNSRGSARWRCQCECGKTTITCGKQLRAGQAHSCGCVSRSELGPRRLKHGHARRIAGKQSRAYHVWIGMKDRCLNVNNRAYSYYGGRGITVCDRWLMFENFHEDMGDPPVGLSLDRIDNEVGYWKANCRWATRLEQSRNRRLHRTWRGRPVKRLVLLVFVMAAMNAAREQRVQP